jgi:hypothetical protein
LGTDLVARSDDRPRDAVVFLFFNAHTKRKESNATGRAW